MLGIDRAFKRALRGRQTVRLTDPTNATYTAVTNLRRLDEWLLSGTVSAVVDGPTHVGSTFRLMQSGDDGHGVPDKDLLIEVVELIPNQRMAFEYDNSVGIADRWWPWRRERVRTTIDLQPDGQESVMNVRVETLHFGCLSVAFMPLILLFTLLFLPFRPVVGFFYRRKLRRLSQVIADDGGSRSNA